MSAITGIFMRNGTDVDPELMKKMNDKLSHRGPDGSSTWCQGPVGLGHQMLWTTPESLHETLPLEEDGLVITADARIDNRAELSEKLGIRDEEDVSDSYFILKAYQKWGDDCPDKLLGDFAFAVWDKAQKRLFCARDHMGVKHLYYHISNDSFLFSTEMKAIFTLEGKSYKLNEEKLAYYLCDINDKKLTFYDGIFALIPANYIKIDSNDIIIKKYWEINPDYKITMKSDEEYRKAFREIFSEAISCRLRSAQPLGFELSGGIDSSSIVVMAKKILSGKEGLKSDIKTFSIIYNGFSEADESYYIQKIIDTGGITPFFIFSGHIGSLDNIKEILWYLEQPFFTPFISNIWNFYENIQKNDIRVLINGNGSDEILTVGHNYFRELIVTFQWKKLIKEINFEFKYKKISFQEIFIRKIFFPLIPDYLKSWGKKWILRSNKERLGSQNISILNDNFAEKLGGKENIKNHYLRYYQPIFNPKNSRNAQYANIDTITDNIYKDIIDRGSSAFSIEQRYPFLDKRLVEFCYGIPTEMKHRSGWKKFILRTSMEDILPKEVQCRTQRGATDQVYYDNFLKLEKKHLEKMIYDDNKLIKDYVNIDQLEYFLKKYLSGYENHDLICLWLVTLVFLWLNETKILKKTVKTK